MSSEGPLQDPDDYTTLVDRVLSTADLSLRQAQIGRHLRTVEANVATAHIDEVLHRCVRGDVRAREVALSLAEMIDHPDHADLELRIEAVHLHARRHGLPGVALFLLAPPPARNPGDRVTAAREQMREPLGVRRSRASGWHPQHLERLLEDDHPMVVERLCANPRILPNHILTIVTRRPTRADVLQTVARTPRWFRDAHIRFAIASNPYGPTGLTLRILPTLPSPQQTHLANASDLHPQVRRAARWWLDQRMRPLPDFTPIMDPTTPG